MAKFKTEKQQAEHQKVYLKDYQPPEYWIRKIRLKFDLHEDHARVEAVSQVELNGEHPRLAEGGKPGPLVLHGEQMDLLEVRVDGEEAVYDVDERRLTVPGVPSRFELKVVTRLEPQKNKALEGLYKSGDIFCTQCEAEGFRRITYYVDRPDNMAVFTTEITADKSRYPVLLSNGNPVESKDLDGGRHYARWEDPHKKPSYLFALVAGDLDHVEDRFRTASGRDVTLRVYVDKGRTDRCAHAMESLKKAMKWDEDRFGLEYDLDLFMIVAVDAFNMGAMENKGLNIFNSKYVLANPATATDLNYQQIESVVGHEYFHNWTGNRVTCRDWFQLSLKEGLTVFRDQEFSSDLFSRPVQRIDDVQSLRSRQFQEDAGPNAHPVRPDSYVAIDNFYTATVYEKGAEVIRMIESVVGREGFRRGVDKYFELFDGQAVTTDDFVRAMELANDADLGQFRRWYFQDGTPRVRAEGEYDEASRSYTLRLSQTCPATPRQKEKLPFHVPVKAGLITRDGAEVEGSARVLHLRETEQSFVFDNVPSEPVPSLFRDFSAPVRFEFDYTESDLALLMASDTNDFNRWEAAQTLYLRNMLRMADAFKKGESAEVSGELVEAFGKALSRAADDRLFASRLLALPDLNYAAQFRDPVDPDALHGAVAKIRSALAGRYEAELRSAYEAAEVQGGYRPVPADMGRRYLRSLCLRYLTALKSDSGLGLAAAQYDAADNMTDQVASLKALADVPGERRDRVFADFYDRWKTDAVVFNTWLSLQARSVLPDTVERVRDLMNDPHVDPENPNNIRSLAGVLSLHNPTQFHRLDGAGYRLLADVVIRMDGVNPQVAARLAGGFDQWRRYDSARRDLMRSEMRRVLEARGLSSNTYEILSNALS